MKKYIKICFITAGILIVFGMAVCVGALAVIDFDVTGLSTRAFQTDVYEIYEDFENISVSTETAELVLAQSSDGVCRIEHIDEEKIECKVEVENGVLKITTVNHKRWYEYIGIFIGTPKLTVYLPKDTYVSLGVNTKTGNVVIPERYGFKSVDIKASTSNISCRASVSESVEICTETGHIDLTPTISKSMILTTSTGNITLTDTICKDVNVKSNTGDIRLSNVNADEMILAASSTGDVTLDGCDAGGISVTTSTGNVKGTLLSEKIFIIDTSTGRVDVPNTVSGGRCEVTTSTGNIEIKIQ